VLGHYGWLTTPDRVEHWAAARNNGYIYFHVRDVINGVSLVEGDRVDFYLYVDEQGLGAEMLSLQSWDVDPSPPATMNVGAADFVPSPPSMPVTSAVCGAALDAFLFHSAYWSDSDTDSSAESEIDQRGYGVDASDGDNSGVECRTRQRCGLQRKLRKKKSQAYSHASSSTGSPSDSDSSAPGSPAYQVRPPPGLRPPPPPGLQLPPGVL